MRTISQSFALIFLLIACSPKSESTKKNIVSTNICDCDQLGDRLERGFYLKYFLKTDSLYTGKCSVTRENGNEIIFSYLKGHIIEEIEHFPGGILKEEMIYDTTGIITKRVQYYSNGHIAYLMTSGSHAYESFYEDGRIARKGGFRMGDKTYNSKDKEFYENMLFDSIWNKQGVFDSVFHYSQASITY